MGLWVVFGYGLVVVRVNTLVCFEVDVLVYLCAPRESGEGS